jgi:hypothetical protein
MNYELLLEIRELGRPSEFSNLFNYSKIIRPVELFIKAQSSKQIPLLILYLGCLCLGSFSPLRFGPR